jgi:hypothetical protein
MTQIQEISADWAPVIRANSAIPDVRREEFEEPQSHEEHQED